MNKPALRITYDAFQWDKGVEDFNNIEKFKSEISENYSSIVKANPIGRGGAAYQFIIDFFVNLTIEDYLKMIGAYIGGKTLDKIADPLLDSYIFKPLKNAYKWLKAENPILDCYSLTIELLNTKIYLYSISPDSIIENKDAILLALDLHFNNLIHEEEFPSEIHIPVYEELINDTLIYRPPLGIEETIDTETSNNFFRLWGLKYQYSYRSVVYDVVNKNILEEVEFMTETELNSYRERNV